MSTHLLGTFVHARLARARGVVVEDEQREAKPGTMLAMPAWSLYVAQLEEWDSLCAMAQHRVPNWDEVWGAFINDKRFVGVINELAGLAADPLDGALLYMVACWVKGRFGVDASTSRRLPIARARWLLRFPTTTSGRNALSARCAYAMPVCTWSTTRRRDAVSVDATGIRRGLRMRRVGLTCAGCARQRRMLPSVAPSQATRSVRRLCVS
jgi:hypothetical protein